MIAFRTRRWLLTCGFLYILFLGLLGMGLAAALGRDDGPAVQAIINHPNVALARANVWVLNYILSPIERAQSIAFREK